MTAPPVEPQGSRPPSSIRATNTDGARAAQRPLDRWRGHRVARRWRYRLAPDPLQRKPKGVLPFWTRMRRLFWAWWPWAAACLWNLVHDKWGWAIGMGLMAFACYLIAPAESAPQYGLDHEFVDRRRGIPADDGRARPGCPSCPGNTLTILNNGDAFYPAMLDAIDAAEVVDHDRGLHLLGRRDRAPVRGGARGEGERRRPRQDPARRGRVIDDRRRHPRDPRERARASWPGTTRSTGGTSAATTIARTASR